MAKYRIYLSDGNRIVVKAEEDFCYNIEHHYKRFFFVGGYLINANQITFIEKLEA